MTIPVLTEYICLGIGFGIVLESKGFGFLWAFAMGLFIYAGSMQFVAVDLLAARAGSQRDNYSLTAIIKKPRKRYVFEVLL